MYRRTGATLSTLKIIRYRHYYNNKIQQILNSILGYIYILFILCIAVSFGILEDQQKSCNRISLTARLTRLQLGLIVSVCTLRIKIRDKIELKHERGLEQIKVLDLRCHPNIFSPWWHGKRKKKKKKSKKLFRLNLSGIFCLKKLHALLHGESLFQALLKTNKVIYCYEAIMRMWAEKSEHTNTHKHKGKKPTKSETTKQSQLLIPDVFCSTHFNLKG